MVVIKNRFLPFKGFIAMNVLGVLFVREELYDKMTAEYYNHELIHTAQMKEWLYIGFYVLYRAEWLWHILLGKDRFTHKAYLNISFEREANANEKNLDYLKERKHYANFKLFSL